MMKQAVSYLRRSTDRQEQSLGDQRTHIQSYAASHGLQILEEFVDDAISGTTTKDRPAFRRMIHVSQHPGKRFDYILVYDVKRFGRVDNDEAGYFRHILRQAGVEVIYTSERFSGTDSDELLLPVLQWQARREAKDLSKVTVRGLLSSAAEGSWLGGVPPFGYDLMYYSNQGTPIQRVHFHHSGDKHVYQPNGDFVRAVVRGDKIVTAKSDRARLVPGDSSEVALVRRIFELYVDQDHGYKKTASLLNNEGLPAPRKGRWARTTLRLWSQSSVRNILMNQTYVGDAIWNRRTEGKFHRIVNGQAVVRKSLRKVEMNKPCDWIITKNAHKALITRSMFHRAQAIINKSHRRTSQPSGRASVSPYLLSSLVVCCHCGSRIHGRRAISGRKSNGKRVTSYSYICGGYVRGGKVVCPSAAISQAVLEAAVTSHLQQRVDTLNQPDIRTRIAEHIGSILEHTTDGLPQQLAKVQDEITRKNAKLSLLVDNISSENVALLDNALTEHRLDLQRLNDETETIQTKLQLARGTRLSPKALVASLGKRLKQVANLFEQGTIVEKRAFLRQLLHRVELDLTNRNGTAFWYRLEDLAMPNPKDHLLGLIGATGFEPATSASRTLRSSQAELRPVHTTSERSCDV